MRKSESEKQNKNEEVLAAVTLPLLQFTATLLVNARLFQVLTSARIGKAA